MNFLYLSLGNICFMILLCSLVSEFFFHILYKHSCYRELKNLVWFKKGSNLGTKIFMGLGDTCRRSGRWWEEKFGSVSSGWITCRSSRWWRAPNYGTMLLYFTKKDQGSKEKQVEEIRIFRIVWVTFKGLECKAISIWTPGWLRGNIIPAGGQ